jgi:hypothetical protein
MSLLCDNKIHHVFYKSRCTHSRHAIPRHVFTHGPSSAVWNHSYIRQSVSCIHPGWEPVALESCIL